MRQRVLMCNTSRHWCTFSSDYDVKTPIAESWQGFPSYILWSTPYSLFIKSPLAYAFVSPFFISQAIWWNGYTPRLLLFCPRFMEVRNTGVKRMMMMIYFTSGWTILFRAYLRVYLTGRVV